LAAAAGIPSFLGTAVTQLERSAISLNTDRRVVSKFSTAWSLPAPDLLPSLCESQTREKLQVCRIWGGAGSSME